MSEVRQRKLEDNGKEPAEKENEVSRELRILLLLFLVLWYDKLLTAWCQGSLSIPGGGTLRPIYFVAYNAEAINKTGVKLPWVFSIDIQ